MHLNGRFGGELNAVNVGVTNFDRRVYPEPLSIFSVDPRVVRSRQNSQDFKRTVLVDWSSASRAVSDIKHEPL